MFGHLFDGFGDDGEPVPTQNPHNRSGSKQGKDKLNDQDPPKSCASKGCDAFRRQWLPGEGTFRGRRRGGARLGWFGLIRLVRRVGLVGSNLCIHRSSRLRALWYLGLILGWGNDERNRIAKFHDIVHEHFDVVSAGNLEFDLAEKSYVGGVKRGVFQAELHLAFSQERCLVRRDQSDRFGEIANPCGPPVEKAEPQGDDRDLRDTDEVHHTDEKEIASDFLANFLAEKGALKIGENAGGVH
jgi:hypothetical protein